MFVTKSKYRQLQKDYNTVIDVKNELIKELNELRTKGMRRLTRGEAECLQLCIGDYIYNQPIIVTENQSAQHLKKLTDKGYLTRIQRGEYKLTFM